MMSLSDVHTVERKTYIYVVMVYDESELIMKEKVR